MRRSDRRWPEHRSQARSRRRRKFLQRDRKQRGRTAPSTNPIRASTSSPGSNARVAFGNRNAEKSPALASRLSRAAARRPPHRRQHPRKCRLRKTSYAAGRPPDSRRSSRPRSGPGRRQNCGRMVGLRRTPRIICPSSVPPISKGYGWPPDTTATGFCWHPPPRKSCAIGSSQENRIST